MRDVQFGEHCKVYLFGFLPLFKIFNHSNCNICKFIIIIIVTILKTIATCYCNLRLDYITENKYFINCAYDSVGYSEIKRFLYTDIIEIFTNTIENGAKQLGIKADENFMKFLSSFYTEALVGMVLSVLQGYTSYTREEIVQNVLFICNVSIPQVLIAHASKGMM